MVFWAPTYVPSPYTPNGLYELMAKMQPCSASAVRECLRPCLGSLLRPWINQVKYRSPSLSVNAYACICACVHVYMYIYRYVYKMFIHSLVCLCMYVVHARMSIHIYVYTYVDTHKHSRKHVGRPRLYLFFLRNLGRMKASLCLLGIL